MFSHVDMKGEMLCVHFQFLPVFVLIHTKWGVRAKSILKYLYTIIPWTRNICVFIRFISHSNSIIL